MPGNICAAYVYILYNADFGIFITTSHNLIALAMEKENRCILIAFQRSYIIEAL